jgi:hypothetical protein
VINNERVSVDMRLIPFDPNPFTDVGRATEHIVYGVI